MSACATASSIPTTQPRPQHPPAIRPRGVQVRAQGRPALSTNPAKLLVQLRKIDGGPHTAREDFVHIDDFLRPQGQGGLPGAPAERDTPPAIRAALYRAAKLIPGVRLLGPARDHAGRTGLGIAWFSHGRPLMELIFDRHTARLLDESTFEPSGQIADWTIYLGRRSSTPCPPPADRAPRRTAPFALARGPAPAHTINGKEQAAGVGPECPRIDQTVRQARSPGATIAFRVSPLPPTPSLRRRLDCPDRRRRASAPPRLQSPARARQPTRGITGAGPARSEGLRPESRPRRVRPESCASRARPERINFAHQRALVAAC